MPVGTALASPVLWTIVLVVATGTLVVEVIIVSGVVLSLLAPSPSSQETAVDTSVGKIQGRRILANQRGDYVYEYLGIPYAKPPVGNLRFEDPVALPKLPQDPFLAYNHGPSCMQRVDISLSLPIYNFEMYKPINEQSEDCLHLNVWVSDTPAKMKPVIIFLHGGNFSSGSSSIWMYDGKALAAEGDLIVVSLNYRLNVFGFISFLNGPINGNMGLKDQQLALQWVHDNIVYFGGDPHSVTLMGHEAGAVSAGYHLLASSSSHYFQKVVQLSGSPFCYYGSCFLGRNFSYVNRTQPYLERTECNVDNPVECLKNLNASEILEVFYPNRSMVPVVDGDFINEAPFMRYYKKEWPKDKPILSGFPNYDGTPLVFFDENRIRKLTDPPLMPREDHIHGSVSMTNEDLDKFLLLDTFIKCSSWNGLSYSGNDRWRVSGKVRTQRLGECSNFEIGKTVNNSYIYQLNYRSSRSPWPAYMGAAHGEELQWIFGWPLNATAASYTDYEVSFGKSVLKYIFNFVRKGNPNNGVLTEWKQFYEAHAPLYMDVDVTSGQNNFTMGRRDEDYGSYARCRDYKAEKYYSGVCDILHYIWTVAYTGNASVREFPGHNLEFN